MNAPFEETFSDPLAEAMAALKARLVARYERHFPRDTSRVRSAIEAAEAVAWCTPFPHLFLPELAEQQISLLVSNPENSSFALAA